MTSPIDVAYVEIRPDVDDFDRAIDKDLDSTFRKMEERALKSTQKVEERFDELEKEIHENFKEIDKTNTTTFNNLEKIVEKTTVKVEEHFARTGERINESFGEGLGDGITEHFDGLATDLDESGRRIEEDTRRHTDSINEDFNGIGEDADKHIRDRDRDIAKSIFDVGTNAGISLGEGIQSSFAGVFDSEVFKLVLIAVLVPAAILAAPVIATALSSAIVAAIPIGFIGLAIFSQLDNPALQQAGRGFANSVKDIFKRASSGLVDNLIIGLDTILNSFQKMEPTITKIFDALEPLTQPLAAGVGDFIENILPGILVAVENSGPAIQEFATGLGDVGAALGDLFAGLAEDPEQLADGMRLLFDFIVNTIYELEDILTFLIDMFTWLEDRWEDVKAIFEGLSEFVGAAIASVTGDWEDFTSFWNIMWDGFAEIGSGTIDAIVGDFNFLREHADEILDAILGFFIRAWHDAVEGFNGAVNRIRKLFSELRDRIFGSTNWGALLYGAGGQVINGLMQGIRNALPDLTGLLNWVTSMIPSWKGPMEKDLHLLEPTGEAIMQGLTTGIEKGEDGLEDTLDTVTNNIGIQAPRGGDGGGITVNMNFNGATPSENDALVLGRAAGRGIQEQMNRRAVRTAVRTA